MSATLEASASLGKLKTIIASHLKRIASAEDLPEDAELASLGLDSMTAMNLLFDIEDQFSVAFDESLLTPEVFKSCRSLHNALLTLL
ncbi:MAG TPA: phosphopantetheine-binding protein [Cellvibrionaceae bacterium]|nr:phosphopantetheine-binding protein [Cellvibrionaceae bacterium]